LKFQEICCFSPNEVWGYFWPNKRTPLCPCRWPKSFEMPPKWQMQQPPARHRPEVQVVEVGNRHRIEWLINRDEFMNLLTWWQLQSTGLLSIVTSQISTGLATKVGFFGNEPKLLAPLPIDRPGPQRAEKILQS
jgi:hypothetical protein